MVNIGDKITIKLPFDEKPKKVIYMGPSKFIPECISVKLKKNKKFPEGLVINVHPSSVVK